jgi:hypothetical protein
MKLMRYFLWVADMVGKHSRGLSKLHTSFSGCGFFYLIIIDYRWLLNLKGVTISDPACDNANHGCGARSPLNE